MSQQIRVFGRETKDFSGGVISPRKTAFPLTPIDTSGKIIPHLGYFRNDTFDKRAMGYKKGPLLAF